jgi:hypothetical protein
MKSLYRIIAIGLVIPSEVIEAVVPTACLFGSVVAAATTATTMQKRPHK